MKKRLFSTTAALGLLLIAFATHAQVLYGTTGAGSTLSTLVELNPADGTLMRTIGPVGYGVNGLTFDASTQTLYASTRQGDPSCPKGLLTINTSTGAGTVVGCGSASNTEGPALLTSDSAGALYSWLEPNSDDLISWNKATGVYSASIGDAGLNTSEHTLSFDTNDVLYLLNYGGNLYTISTSTGASTLVHSGMPSGHHGDFHPTSNRLYVINGTSDPRTIRVLNISTRTQDAEFSAPNGLHTLAFASGVAPVPVPTLSQWAIVLLGLLFGAVMLLRFRRN